MRACSFFFLFWWTIFICIAWRQTYKPVHRWRVHKNNKRISKKIILQPIQFRSVNILWINPISDKISIDIVQTTSPEMGEVRIKHMEMEVFETPSRENVSEIYSMPFEHDRAMEYTHIGIIQDDVHLSPFRRLKIYPEIIWSFGNVKKGVGHERQGKFIGSVWQEGQELNMSIGLTFLAWAAGLFFVVVTRQSSKRKIRVFINQKGISHDQKGISHKTNIKEISL
jgi:hypothetical protein